MKSVLNQLTRSQTPSFSFSRGASRIKATPRTSLIMANPRRSARLSSSSLASTPSSPPQLKSTASASKKRKAAATDIDKDGFVIPSTPKRTKSNEEPPIALPETPTPAAAKGMGLPYEYSSGDITDSTPPPPPANRLANPLATNAPLISPMSSRVVSRGSDIKDETKLSATRNGSGEFESTTDHILEEALSHLIKVDPRLKPVIEKHTCKVFSREGLMEVIDPFRSLCSGIISQQVSGAAAKAILIRFIALFNPPPQTETDSPSTTPHTFPTPHLITQTPLPTLRSAGLSQRKAEYIQGLAQKFAEGSLTTEFLMSASYEEVVEELVKVRGLGLWSVEMFACFGLKRLDVFSTGDLGVQRGMAALEGRDVAKLKSKGKGKWKYMSEQDMLDISSKFAPYSVFMWYMWRVEDTDVSSLEGTG